jgi:Fanconi-associated nuclease 1
MALQSQTPAVQNQMLGSKIRHPSSTNFDEEFLSSPAKRVKRLHSTDSSLSREDEGRDEQSELQDSPAQRKEIADSEDETDQDEIVSRSQQTDLESALAPVKTDKEAIADYEAARAAEVGEIDLQGRLSQRKWVQGKSSIYVDAFNLALETVLEDEAHLFNEAEMAVFEDWKGLSYEGQYL